LKEDRSKDLVIPKRTPQLFEDIFITRQNTIKNSYYYYKYENITQFETHNS